MSCSNGITYDLDSTYGPCLIYLVRTLPNANTISTPYNLDGATVNAEKDEEGNVAHWYLKTRTGEARISTSSSFTLSELQTLIQNCNSGSSGVGEYSVVVEDSTSSVTIDENNLGQYIRLTGTTPTITADPIAASFLGQRVYLRNETGAQLTLAAGSGVTLNGLLNWEDQETVALVVVGEDEYDVVGGTS